MTTSTFAQATPTRPGLADVGGGDKIGSTPGDPKRALLPDEANQLAHQAVAAGGMIPAALVSVRWSGSAYVINSVASPNPNLTLATASTLLTVTKNATGDVSITWGPTLFPSPIADHDATATGATFNRVVAETLTLGARVRIQNASGTATDGSFNLRIH